MLSSYRGELFETEHIDTKVEYRLCGFQSVTLFTKFGKKGEAYIGIVELIAFDVTARADGRTITLEFDNIVTKSVLVVTLDRAIRKKIFCVRDGFDAFVANVFEVGRIVHQAMDKFRIGNDHLSKAEPFSFEDGHRCFIR